MNTTDGNLKRSKRHRTQRNHISTKDLYESIKSFAMYAQDVNRKYNIKLQKQNASRPYFH